MFVLHRRSTGAVRQVCASIRFGAGFCGAAQCRAGCQALCNDLVGASLRQQVGVLCLFIGAQCTEAVARSAVPSTVRERVARQRRVRGNGGASPNLRRQQYRSCVLHFPIDANFLGYGCVLLADCCSISSSVVCMKARMERTSAIKVCRFSGLAIAQRSMSQVPTYLISFR